ncbi:MAG: DUF2520 domain-containing protein [Desulfobacterales bacterium]|nr:DUF2520 domain-containing protein [Desulfobacterales bacterium]
MKPSFAIVGCGKVGTAIGKFLSRAGYGVAGLASKSLSSAKRLSEIIDADQYSRVNWEITPKADIVFITTPDSVIKDVCDTLVQHDGFCEKAIVLHCSGVLSSTILSSAKNCGAFIGSLHPLQSFVSVDVSKNPFEGVIVSVEGESVAVNAAREITKDLNAIFMEIKTDAKTLYHASAVVASNYLVTLLDLSFRLIEAAGVPRAEALKILKPLIKGTLANIEKVGIPQALTGPIERGDVETLQRHITEIRDKMPDLLPIYKTLSRHTINIAQAKGNLSESAIQKLKQILGPSMD